METYSYVENILFRTIAKSIFPQSVNGCNEEKNSLVKVVIVQFNFTQSVPPTLQTSIGISVLLILDL